MIILKTSQGENKKLRVDAEEQYLAYGLLQQSGRQHAKLKSNIHNEYTTGYDRYPNTWHNTLHLLTQYTNLTIPRNSDSQGKYSVQKTGDGRNPKHMTRPTGNINSDTIVTKKVIHILIVQTTRIKGMMTTTSCRYRN